MHWSRWFDRKFRSGALFCVLVTVSTLSAARQVGKDDSESTEGVRDFSFIHMSDTHVEAYPTSLPVTLEDARSYLGVRSLSGVESITMPPFQLTAPRPSFALVTGDVTEFGFPGLTEQVVDAYFSNLRMPVYLAAGNHDNTQVSKTDYWRKRFGGQNYSFNSNGCHFVVLNSASLQDPNPSIAKETLHFLVKDLEKVRPSTPVFVALHHPLHSGEFASAYDTDRVLDELRRHNVILLLVGHGHSAVTHDFAGIDGVMGGSTFLAKRQKAGHDDGYGVCYVKGDQLYYAYRPFEKIGATRRLLEKRIPRYSDYPVITISSPTEASTQSGSRIALTAGVAGTTGSLSEAYWSLDDETTGNLTIADQALYASLEVMNLDPGAHFIRICFKDGSGRQFQRSTMFYYEPGSTKKQGGLANSRKPTISAEETSGIPRVKWRYQMDAASKAMPLVINGTVYVGANDGRMRAINANTGKLVWIFDAGAEILTSALAAKDLIIFGAGNGKLFAVQSGNGKQVWTFNAGAAIYSSPVAGPDGEVYFGTNSGEMFAINAADGKQLWRNRDALYSVESSPILDGDCIYFGSWDGNLYALNRKNGQMLWKQAGAKNQERVIRYHAPADAPAVVVEGRVYAPDRGYLVGAIEAVSGDFQTTVSADTAAITLASDRRSLYTRGVGSPLKRISLDGTVLWEGDFIPGRIPVPPVESDGILYVCSNIGALHAVSAQTGRTLWKYRVTPKLYVMAPPAVANNTIYAVGYDGTVTAIATPKP